jgi:thiamine-monophosphate kinase
MIDVSDGLAADVRHLAAASAVGVVLDPPAVPLATGATLDDALGGGEDYELIFTLPSETVPDTVVAFSGAGLRRPTVIGRCTSQAGELGLGDEALPALGWEHRW